MLPAEPLIRDSDMRCPRLFWRVTSSLQLVFLLLLAWTHQSMADSPAGTLLRGQISIKDSGYKLNRKTGQYLTTVTLKNISRKVLHGPITLMLMGSNRPDATPVTGGYLSLNGITGYQLSLPGTQLRPGKALKLRVSFTNPSRKPLKVRYGAYGLLAPGKSAQPTLGLRVDPSSLNAGGTATLVVQGGSGSGSVTFAVVASGGATCTVDGSRLLTSGQAGRCEVTAIKAEDADYLQARSSPFVVTVNNSPVSGKKTQSPLMVNAPSVMVLGGSTELAITGGSGGGLVTFEAVPTTGTTCTIEGTTLKSGGSGPGKCLVTATKAGDDAYDPIISKQFEIAVNEPPSVNIQSPASLITVGASPLSVTGNISGRGDLTVNGAPVTLDGNSFTVNVDLQEGYNVIAARLVDRSGLEATDSITVTLDKTPPYITVESPLDGSTVWTPTVDISGLVNDIVRGTVSEEQANVVAGDKAATVANRSYIARAVQLKEGENLIDIHATDFVGNSSQKQVRLIYRKPAPRHIETVSGDGQTSAVGTQLDKPIKVKLFDEQGAPLSGQQVLFRVVQGDGQVGVGKDQGTTALVTSGSDGTASTVFRLGMRAGSGNQRVRAAAVGFDGESIFTASAVTSSANKISVNSGNNQRAALGGRLPLPLVVVATDAGANLVQGATVEFTVTAGDGTFQNGNTSMTVQTDSDGRASAEFTIGQEKGLDVHRVTATLRGTAVNAGFTASGLTTGDPGATSISGLVFDNQDRPLPKVTVRIDGTTRQAETDVNGHFRIDNAPIGPVRLVVDGSTTTVPGEWPTLPFNLVNIAGADNTLPAPVYLVGLDTRHATYVGIGDTAVSVPDVPGFSLEVKDGSVTFPNGKKSGWLSITPVSADKVPMPPPDGLQPQLIVTIQPVGARFDPPARLTVPNVDGYKPGAQVELHSFDHDLEEFVSIGLGTVSEDGRLIRSNPGVGVIKAGWHAAIQPAEQGCALSPTECQELEMPSCSVKPRPNNTSLAAFDVAGDCRTPKCFVGIRLNQVNDNDIPKNNPCSNGCKNGTPVSKQEKAPCDDEKFCTRDDQCNNGICAGKEIKDVDKGTVGVSFDVKKLVRGAELFNYLLGWDNKADPDKPQGGGIGFSFEASQKRVLKCCEVKKRENVNVREVRAGVTGSFSSPRFRPPGLAFDIRAIQLGLFGQITGGIGGNIGGQYDDCSDNKCYVGNVAGSLGGSFGVDVRGSNLLEVSGFFSTAGKLETDVGCTELKYGWSWDGLKGTVTAEFFDGSFVTNYAHDFIPGGFLDNGSIALTFK